MAYAGQFRGSALRIDCASIRSYLQNTEQNNDLKSYRPDNTSDFDGLGSRQDGQDMRLRLVASCSLVAAGSLKFEGHIQSLDTGMLRELQDFKPVIMILLMPSVQIDPLGHSGCSRSS